MKMKIKQLFCRHEQSRTPVRYGYGKEITIGWFCLKCFKFWVRNDLEEILEKYDTIYLVMNNG